MKILSYNITLVAFSDGSEVEFWGKLLKKYYLPS